MPTYTNPRVRDAVRAFNKRVLNPVMRLLAGRRYWYASMLRHTGRRSGRSYSTPVVADVVADGIIVPLPYGTGVDWLRNVLADGQATITTHGRTYQVSDPEVIDADTAEPQLPPRRRDLYHRFDVDRYVKFARAD
ncbi:nitroreductase/quinone reductase family protein [Mycolicibacterium palauense]|uniref:nitroreductase/quinone reductase family protein n=1 Tax=Mycolicibacterium palauense TaxID=2034511 RepID=UPI000BFEC900|nr:nitroreductase/quinone reductase family protein [Mycolicibacterium palauense]